MKNSQSNIGPTGHMIPNTRLHNYQQQYYRGGGVNTIVKTIANWNERTKQSNTTDR